MHQYNVETLGFLSVWEITITVLALIVLIITVIMLWNVSAFCLKALGFGHQPNEDDPEWLEYCKKLDKHH